MKLRKYIVIGLLLIISDSYAQQDSVARIRKPVLLYLLEQEKNSRFLSGENKILQAEVVNLTQQINLQKNIISSHKVDSVLSADLMRIEKHNAFLYKKMYDDEKKKHKRTRSKLVWRTVLLVGVTAYIAIASF